MKIKDGKSYGEKALWQAFSLFLGVFSLFINLSSRLVISGEFFSELRKRSIRNMGSNLLHEPHVAAQVMYR